MVTKGRYFPLIDHTPDGPQYMLDGFTPVGVRERLEHLAGQPMPASFGRPITAMGTSNNTLMPSKRTFKQYGQSGLWVSDWYPNIAEHVDDMTVIRSVWVIRSAVRSCACRSASCSASATAISALAVQYSGSTSIAFCRKLSAFSCSSATVGTNRKAKSGYTHTSNQGNVSSAAGHQTTTGHHPLVP